MSDNTPLLTVAVLLEELKEVDNWRLLGAYLNVPVHLLDKINIEHDGVVEHCKMYMLQYWLDTTMTASWNDVARALEQINQLKLAAILKLKYLRTSLAAAADESNKNETGVPPLPQQANVETEPLIDDTALEVDIEVISDLYTLESDLVSIMIDTRKDLKECDIEELQFYLDDHFGVDEFHKCKNVGEVLRKLRHNHIDTFNIRDLKSLVIRFHQSEAIVKKIKEYEEKKEEFLRATTVKEFQQAVVSKAEAVTPKGMAAVTIKIPEQYGVPRTMKDVEELAKKGLKSHHKEFVKIHVKPNGGGSSSSVKRLQQQVGNKSVDTAIQADYLAVAPNFLSGVEVYGETVLEVVGDKSQKLEWPGYGFYIEIPDGALAPGVTASVAVKVILEGQFTLPDENSQLISAIYWISSSEVFLKELTVNIQHYAVIMSEEQCSKFRFIVARCSQEVLPYTFREKEGLFNAHTRYGAIRVKQFSIFAQTGPEGTDLRITSLKFYKPQPNTCPLLVDFEFVVLFHHELFLKAVRQQYRSNNYQEDRQKQMLVFEKDEIVLDLPTDDPELKVVDGWKIQPLTYPQVEKVDLEQFKCDMDAPACTIELKWTGDGEPQQLSHQVTIIGAKKPANFFHIRYSPQAVVSTNTVPDTPSGATPTVQDVTASHAEHSEQDNPLNKPPKMNDLLNRVASRAMKKWEMFGLQLNIPTDQLSTIQKSSPILCYAEVFNLWERKSDPPFTWATIVEALRSPIVDEESLAKDIEDWLK